MQRKYCLWNGGHFFQGEMSWYQWVAKLPCLFKKDVIWNAITCLFFMKDNLSDERLTCWGWEKMAAILQTTFSNASPRIKNVWISIEISMKCVPRVQRFKIIYLIMGPWNPWTMTLMGPKSLEMSNHWWWSLAILRCVPRMQVVSSWWVPSEFTGYMTKDVSISDSLRFQLSINQHWFRLWLGT